MKYKLVMCSLIGKIHQLVLSEVDMKDNSAWFVYLLRCNDNSLYCGVTTDLQRRLKEHNESEKGAKYTRARRPVTLAFNQSASCRREACRLEAYIKKKTKAHKEALIDNAVAIVLP